MLRGNLYTKIDDKGRLKIPTAFRALIAEKYGEALYVTSVTGEFDKQGRVSIHGRLRESAQMLGAVDVFGQYDHLEVWNHERFVRRLDQEPFTDDDARSLADFGI